MIARKQLATKKVTGQKRREQGTKNVQTEIYHYFLPSRFRIDEGEGDSDEEEQHDSDNWPDVHDTEPEASGLGEERPRKKGGNNKEKGNQYLGQNIYDAREGPDLKYKRKVQKIATKWRNIHKQSQRKKKKTNGRNIPDTSTEPSEFFGRNGRRSAEVPSLSPKREAGENKFENKR